MTVMSDGPLALGGGGRGQGWGETCDGLEMSWTMAFVSGRALGDGRGGA